MKPDDKIAEYVFYLVWAILISGILLAFLLL